MNKKILKYEHRTPSGCGDRGIDIAPENKVKILTEILKPRFLRQGVAPLGVGGPQLLRMTRALGDIGIFQQETCNE